MKIDSVTVQLVLAIADEGSISRVADKLNLAVAAASRRLTDLEQQVRRHPPLLGEHNEEIIAEINAKRAAS